MEYKFLEYKEVPVYHPRTVCYNRTKTMRIHGTAFMLKLYLHKFPNLTERYFFSNPDPQDF